jgi:hypothetical protein
MGEFVLENSGVEVAGEVLLGFMRAFPDDMKKWGEEILTRNRIHDPKPGGWYPLQRYLDALKDTSEVFGGSMLRNVGSAIPFSAITYEKVDSVAWEKLLKTMDTAYKRNLRGVDVGSITYESMGDSGGLSRARLTYALVSPCAYDHGVLEGVAKRWKPEGTTDVVVRHDDSMPCRHKGEDSCSYIVSWG